MSRQETSTVSPKLHIGPCTLVEVHDADTFRVDVPITALIPSITEMVPNIRLAHVNAAELSTADGKAATQRVVNWFAAVQPFTLLVFGPDKYGRTLGDVLLPDGTLLSTFVLTLSGTVPMSVHKQLLHQP